MTNSMENLMKNLGVLLVAFLVAIGISRLMMAQQFLTIGSGVYGVFVLAILLSLVISFFIPIPIIGAGIGAFLGTFISFWVYSWMVPIMQWSFGAGFGIIVALLTVSLDYLAMKLMK